MDISCRIRHRRYATGASTVGRQTLGSARDRKRKCNPWTVIWHRPQTAMMTLDNGATDGESDSHTVILGGVERLEEPVDCLRGKSDSRILHHQTHMTVFVFFGSNQQLPRTIVNCTHRVASISEQVQDDLLQL